MTKTLRIVVAIVCASIATALTAFIFNIISSLTKFSSSSVYPWLTIIFYCIAAIGGFLLGLFLSLPFTRKIESIFSQLKHVPVSDIIAGAIGLTGGLFIAYLLSYLTTFLPFYWLSVSLSVFLYLLLGYSGLRMALSRYKDLNPATLFRKQHDHDGGGSASLPGGSTPLIKLLDTSVIIDGRIYDICKAGFLEGELVVPSFVLTELRTISDVDDDLKRIKGRRGLDILSNLQNELSRPVTVNDKDYDDLPDVDSKLLRMAQEMNAAILTNDFNLNKVAKVQNIPVLNINDLANAVKPVAIPGEFMNVQIIKAGKEHGQGVAYLDDGTMVVVENGLSFLNKTIDIIVTSSLQTSAGRMIFGKPQ